MLLKTAALYVVIMLICAVALAGDYMAGIRVPDDVRVVLEKAGDNRVELERVIARYHYAGADDSLKLAAAYFLIGNMEGHSYVTFELRDSAGAEIEFANTDYVNYDSLLAAWEVMEKEHPGLDFEKKDAIEDIASIKAEFLIDNIDRAFAAWQSRPWARGFSFEDFREYILPYRGSNEPLENWRAHFMEKYSGIESTMTDPSDAVEAARIINKDVMTYFTFDPRYYYHPTDQGLGEMLSGHLGRCEDMTNITIYAMRANGLAVTSDYTPYWANSGNNHAWNAIVTPNSRAIPFMGAEANPGEYSLANKLAKVYRKMYSKQADNLTFQTRKQVGVPGWLAGKSYIDVTQDYIPTRDITVTLEKPAPDTVDVAYICVFNDGEWEPISFTCPRTLLTTIVSTPPARRLSRLKAAPNCHSRRQLMSGSTPTCFHLRPACRNTLPTAWQRHFSIPPKHMNYFIGITAGGRWARWRPRAAPFDFSRSHMDIYTGLSPRALTAMSASSPSRTANRSGGRRGSADDSLLFRFGSAWHRGSILEAL
jgi:hypothetical protein